LFTINKHNIQIFILLVSTTCFSQIYNTEVEAKINLESNTEFIEIVGSAYNKTDFTQSLRYVLSVIKNNPQNSNRSKNDQSGRVVIESGQKINLSKTTINADDEDRIIILLLVYDSGDNLMGKDRIVINGNEEDKKQAALEESAENINNPDQTHYKDDGVVLRGFVVDETKTKLGNDFYKTFEFLNRRYNLNGEKIIIVKELLAIGNNTKIEVIIDNIVLIEFILKPQKEYLEEMGMKSIKRAYNYFKELREGNLEVKHY